MSLNRLQQYLNTSMEEFQEEEAPLVPEDGELAPEDNPVNDEAVAEMEVEIPEQDETVGDAEMLEADDDLAVDDELVEESAEEDEMLVDSIDDAETETESLEHFQTVLKHGLKTNTFSPQFATTVQAKLDHMDRLFNKSTPSVALESFSGDDMRKFYEVSLESIAGFMKRLSDVMTRLGDKLIDKINNKTEIESALKAAKAINTKADALITKINESDRASAQIGSQRLGRALSLNGTPASPMMPSIAADQKLVSSIAAKDIPGSIKHLDKLLDVIDQATLKGGVGKTGEFVTKALAVTPAKWNTGEFLGGEGFKYKDVKEASGAGNLPKLKILAKSSVPEWKRYSKSKTGALFTVTKADVLNLLKAAKVYASMSEKLADGTGRKFLETFARRLKTMSRSLATAEATSWAEGKEVDVLMGQIETMTWDTNFAIQEIRAHCKRMGNDLISVAEMFLKAKAVEPKGE